MNKFSFHIFLCFLFLLIGISSCTSPESDGKKAGEKYLECNKDYVLENIDALKDFIEHFDPEQYTSRTEARRILLDADSLALLNQEKAVEKAEKFELDKRKKYVTNAEKIQQFDYALQATIRECDNEISELTGECFRLQSEANDLINKIIPTKPTADKIAADLAGKVIVEPTHTLHRRQFAIENADMVKDVQIESVQKLGDCWVYAVHLSLNDGINDYKADVKINYELPDYDDWTIQYVESKFLDIIPTGNYFHCIVSERNEWLGGSGYVFSNNCDVPLVVEGKGLGEYNGHVWEYVSKLVSAHSTAVATYYLDFKIERVERP